LYASVVHIAQPKQGENGVGYFARADLLDPEGLNSIAVSGEAIRAVVQTRVGGEVGWDFHFECP
jgi:hypothetical protein